MFAIRNKLSNQILGIDASATDDGEVYYTLSTYSTHKFVVDASLKYILDRVIKEDYEGYGLEESPYRYSSIKWNELEVVELGVK